MKVKIETETNVAIAENQIKMDAMDKKQVKMIESAAEQMIENNIKDMIARVQQEYNADIFGFGEMIYKKDPRLWDKLMPVWDELFPTVEAEVTSKVNVVNSAFIK